MNDNNLFHLPETEQEATHILDSVKTRHQLLESLNQRIELLRGNPPQHLQDWIDDLKEQQIDDLNIYKSNLLFAPGRSQQELTEFDSIGSQELVTNEQNNWKETFADGFIQYLESENSEFHSIWIGNRHQYPIFIGFDIRRLSDNFEFFDPNACWLAVFLKDNRQIFVGLHTRSPYIYQRLEVSKEAVNFQFRQQFGTNLGWKPGNEISKIITLAGVYSEDNSILFQSLYRMLEQLDELFRNQLEDIINQQSRFVR